MSRGGAVKSGCGRAVEIFLEYETPKIVHIQSKKVGIVNRLIQFFIIAYIALLVTTTLRQEAIGCLDYRGRREWVVEMDTNYLYSHTSAI